MGYEPQVVSTTISSKSVTILQLEGISIAPNGVESLSLDSRGLKFGSLGSLTAASDGVWTLLNNAGTSFGRIQFGGTTSSFVALATGTGPVLALVLGDNSANATFRCGGIHLKNNTLLMSGTAPTISSGFGSSPSITTNGTTAFSVNVGTGGSATSGVIGVPSASTTGWIAWVQNLTAQAANRADQRTVMTASTANTITVQNQTISTGAAVAWSASDVLLLTCFAY